MLMGRRFAWAVMTAALAIAGMARAEDALPVEVAAKDAAVHLVGRWDASDAAGPRGDWSGITVALRFSGSALNVRLKGDKAALQVVIDGKPMSTIELSKEKTRYEVARDLDGKEHLVELVKRGEAFTGKVQLLGFEIAAGGKALEWTAKPAHRIEMIGDSITCGYGNEAADKSEHFSPKTENAYFTWGMIAARQFDAECTVVAWSGRKMFPNNTMPAVYGQSLGTDAKSTWDFATWTPDAVVINLATNDFANKATVPDEKGWIEAYEAFISKTVRKHYPKAAIFISTSPMMSGQAQANLKKYLETVRADLAAAGDEKVYILEIATQNAKDGYGADWHPNIKTQEKMAATLGKALEEKLGWKKP